MKYAICQMDLRAGEPEANRERVREWIQETVKKESPDVVVLPEMWTTAYTLDRLEEVADRDGEPTRTLLQGLAKAHNVHMIGGSIANKKDGQFYNTALIISNDGEVIHEYDKIHLVPMLDEPKYLSGGHEKGTIFELDGIKMGVITCYDLRFPELARSLALQGAQVLHVVAEWPMPRKDHWKPLHQARAIENQMYVISCNRVGETNGTTFCGTSMVVDAWGSVIAEGSEDREETIVATVDLQEVAKVREGVPSFESRVPELYD